MPENKKTRENPLVTGYLLLYNVGQCCGWAAVLLLMAMHVGQHKSWSGIYADVRLVLNIFQSAALLEIVHAVFGLVKSSPVLTGFQVMSRILVIWHVHSVPYVQDQIGAPMFLLAWSVTEVIRYSFYSCSLLGTSPYFLQWCRYTFFIALYPIGVTGELLSIYWSLPYVEKTGLLTVPLPNAANMSFNYYVILHVIMMSYVPIFPQLYMHMFKQRRKVVGNSVTKKD